MHDLHANSKYIFSAIFCAVESLGGQYCLCWSQQSGPMCNSMEEVESLLQVNDWYLWRHVMSVKWGKFNYAKLTHSCLFLSWSSQSHLNDSNQNRNNMQIILNSLYLNNGTYKHDEMLPCFSCLLRHTHSCFRNDIYCVWWGVKLYSLTHYDTVRKRDGIVLQLVSSQRGFWLEKAEECLLLSGLAQ